MAQRLSVVQGEGAKPKNAKEALGAQKEEHLVCRDLRHPWSIVGMFYVGSEVHRKLVCERCGTEATDRWTKRGGRIARRYKYSPGYQTHVGVRIRPQDVRREVMNRFEVYATEEDMLASLFRGRSRKRA